MWCKKLKINMNKLDFNQFDLKKAQIGVRISKTERANIEGFCQKNGVIISELVRYAVRKALNEK